MTPAGVFATPSAAFSNTPVAAAGASATPSASATPTVAAFPEAAGFGIGTKLSSEVKNVAGVIFKACMIDGRPTLKASNSLDKTTLPGCMQVFRGVDASGNYVGDVTGLQSEDVEIAVEEDVRGSFIQDCEVCCSPWLVRVARTADGVNLAVTRADGSD